MTCKKALPLLTGLLLLLASARAQIDAPAQTVSHYVLPAFQPGKVLQKNGSETTASLNYNALTGEMIFDAGNSRYLAIAEPEKVDSVFISGRTFIPREKLYLELLVKGNYPLAVEHTCSLIEEGNNVGYNLSSNVSASSPLRSMMQNGSAYGLKLPDGVTVKSGKAYWGFRKGRWEKVSSFSQLGKVYADKKAEIDKAVKEKKLSFNKEEDLLNLVKQINE
ncbi:hypothetical protein [Flavihumibacter petaseus]|uniref:Uncharacterized protein n=1 Tax=Flavihumibacter petaseus NBRC 106054 TaxID=1220578 RepID=A0A0E9MUW9_9BACT|nr:hypothetical protein [Flavihumibacter petaseus]GAO41547.1 hypothetical protein FPE01S_01_05610 [Flavihumibacter petaseus NBRC 106054]